jgi:hypothetical protein
MNKMIEFKIPSKMSIEDAVNIISGHLSSGKFQAEIIHYDPKIDKIYQLDSSNDYRVHVKDGKLFLSYRDEFHKRTAEALIEFFEAKYFPWIEGAIGDHVINVNDIHIEAEVTELIPSVTVKALRILPYEYDSNKKTIKAVSDHELGDIEESVSSIRILMGYAAIKVKQISTERFNELFNKFFAHIKDE